MKKNETRFVFFISIVSVVIIGLTLIAYILSKLINFKYFTNSEEYIFHTDKLGHFGDFIGGFLGTILTGIATFLVYKTYISQKEELDGQRKLIAQQQFESTFFNMLNVHRELKNNLSIIEENNIINGVNVFNHIISKNPKLGYNYCKDETGLIGTISGGKEWYVDKNTEAEKQIEIKKSQEDFDTNYDDIYKKYRDLLDHYCINIYYILKFINDNEKIDETEHKIEKYKNYASIFSSQLGNKENIILKWSLIHINQENNNMDIIKLIKRYNFLSLSSENSKNIDNRKFYFFDVN